MIEAKEALIMSKGLNNLSELAAAAGLEIAGVAPPTPPAALVGWLQRRAKEGRETPFEEKDLQLRLAPERLLPGCRSIIVFGVSHAGPEQEEHPVKGGPRGEVARFARGPDYHLTLKGRAERLLELLKKELPGPLEGRILIDRSPLVERELARQAGLGWIGENCTLITPAGGSYISLGTLLLNRDLEPDSPLQQDCRRCGRCREACPTGALLEPFIIDPHRCLSYITQSAGIVPAALRPLLGARLYGCDRCQEVCPQNASAGGAVPAPFTFFPARPLLPPILEITKTEFARTVGVTAAGWRGKSILQRNAVIALGNSGNRDAVSALAHLLKCDPRPLLRLHAAWALGNLGGRQARRHLEQQLHREEEPAVLEELRLALAPAGP
ncbi:MAG TPA: tRNA epoxyqueuosine(34) reductase QueG [Firmicutes bacterium]|nr:tRNA epoxyqueuosine(34) reductase QueG [Bacillota bacterium]